MEPFAVLGLAGNIIQFFDFATKIVKAAAEAYESASGALEDDEEAQASTARLESLLSRLEISKPASQLNQEEIDLNILASQCRSISRDLLELLDSLRANNPTSKKSRVKAALKSVWKQSDKDRLERRLERGKTTLSLYLNQLSQSEIIGHLNRIAAFAQSTKAELTSLNHNIKFLSSGLEVDFLGPEAQKQIRNVIQLSEEADRQVRTSRILNALESQTATERFTAVSTAHSSTFRWLLDSDVSGFKPDNSGDNSIEPVRVKAREQFAQWLESGSGIFHFTGKLGSGKSTLMKFLYRHPRTTELLNKWAGPKQLALGQHFFWKPGTELQKNFNGLIRGLLYTLLHRSPELVQILAPEQWKVAAFAEIHFDNEMVEHLFDNLIKHEDLHEKYKIVLFIDGLDEFEGESVEMARRLASWTVQHEGIKICVSSRDWPVFEEAFKPCLRVRLHTITETDISRFVRARMEENESITSFNDLPCKEELVKSIIKKANGVFLWVSVILREVEDGLINGDSPHDLLRKVGTLPTELEDMFRHLLDSIHPADRQKAYATLRFVLQFTAATSGKGGLLLIRQSFLEDYLDNKNLVSRKKTNTPKDEELLQRLARARKRVHALGRGLLDCRTEDRVIVKKLKSPLPPELAEKLLEGSLRKMGRGPNNVPSDSLASGMSLEVVHRASLDPQAPRTIYDETIRFNHRSIVEFLMSEEVAARLDKAFDGSNFLDAWCQGLLAQLRLVNMIRLPREVELAFGDPKFKGGHIDEIQTMISWAMRFEGNHQITRQFCTFLDSLISDSDSAVSPLISFSCRLSREVGRMQSTYIHYEAEVGFSELIVLLCHYFGFHEYITWRREPQFRECTSKKHIRLWMLTGHITDGALWPKAHLQRNWSRLARAIDVYLEDPTNSANEVGYQEEESCFFHLLWDFVTAFRQPPSLSFIAVYLYHGADPRFYINFQKKWKNVGKKLRGLQVTVLTGPMKISAFSSEFRYWIANITTLSHQILQEKSWTLSLRDLVGLWFPNHAKPLQDFIGWRCQQPVDLSVEGLAELKSTFGASLRGLFELGIQTEENPSGCLGLDPGFEVLGSFGHPDDLSDAAQQDWDDDDPIRLADTIFAEDSD